MFSHYEIIATKDFDSGIGPPYQPIIRTRILAKDEAGQHFVCLDPAVSRQAVNDDYAKRFIQEAKEQGHGHVKRV